jgi:hypothetical protein
MTAPDAFASARAIVIRATWDYHESPDAYRAWLARLDPRRTFNSPDLVRWNLSKRHVLELGARGAVVPRTVEVAADASAIAAALDSLELRTGVVKPLIGASGFGVERVTRGAEAHALALLPAPALYARVDGLVRDGAFVLMELEVNEPDLGLDLAAGAPERFADALLARLA